MKLKKAIQRAAKVCSRKVEKAALQVIRFLPACQDGPPYVFATDGLRSVLIKVDCDDLPNVLLPVGDLVKVAKDPGNLKVTEIGYGRINLATGIGVYRIQGLSFDHYPIVPTMPSAFTQIVPGDWDCISKVFHAAAKETEEPELAVIHFTPGYVEATDKNRLVRVEVLGTWEGLVPANMFKVWGKGEVLAAFTDTHAFFQVGDELRIGHLLHTPNYPKTTAVVPVTHVGPFIVVHTRSMLDAVQRGSELSDLGMVTIEITDRLVIRAWSEQKERNTYEAEIPLQDGTGNEGNEGMLLVAGKYLAEALNQVDTVNVHVGFGNVFDPIRIESGVFTAVIWPMCYV